MTNSRDFAVQGPYSKTAGMKYGYIFVTI